MLLFTLTINSILLVKFSKKIHLITYIPLSYIVNCISIYLVGFAMSKLSGLSIEEITTGYFSVIILDICTIIATCLVLYLVRLLIQKYLIRIFEKINKNPC